jgi:hypothetical protein
MSTASSASRTNVACRSAAVYTAMTRSAGRPSAFHSRTALISRMAGSPRLTIATRPKAKAGWLIRYSPKAARMSSLVLPPAPVLARAAAGRSASGKMSRTTSSATIAGSIRITA